MPTMSPTPHCFGMPDCPCFSPQCFEQRDPDTCQCACPFEVLYRAHIGDASFCGTEYPLHRFIDSACACDCPLGARPVHGCPGMQTFNEVTCQCECPQQIECKNGQTLNPDTCQCDCPAWSPHSTDCAAINKVLRDCKCECINSCPGAGQVQSTSSCRCGCPANTPSSFQCPSGVLDEMNCACAVALHSDHCCIPTVAGFTAYNGFCWRHQDEASCMLEPHGKCVWNPESCVLDPPRNRLDPSSPCLFRNDPCTKDSDCCSEVCRSGPSADGFCR